MPSRVCPPLDDSEDNSSLMRGTLIGSKAVRDQP